MEENELTSLTDYLLSLGRETEWVEFKENYSNPDGIGKYISALSNGACLEDKNQAYLLFGIEDKTLEVKGTSFKPLTAKKGNELLQHWLISKLSPKPDLKIREFEYEGRRLAIMIIGPARDQPIRFNNIAHVRINSVTRELAKFPDLERKIWAKSRHFTFEQEIAVRELVANALIHQDFLETGTHVKVEIFSDRVEVSNPGSPLVDKLRLIDDFPRSRNEALAKQMRDFGICEERGSGIDKVVASCELFQLPAPRFNVKGNHMQAILYSYKELTKMDKGDRVRACYQHAVLKYISNDFMTNTSLRERFNIEPSNYPIASRIIRDTLEAKLIKPSDPTSKSRKHAKYIPFWAD